MLRCIVVAGMGFHQLAVRCLSCLVLNHLQLPIVALVKRSFETVAGQTCKGTCPTSSSRPATVERSGRPTIMNSTDDSFWGWLELVRGWVALMSEAALQDHLEELFGWIWGSQVCLTNVTHDSF